MADLHSADRDATETDVVVVGGGIGGLSAALALHDSGRRVTVLERASEFTEIGAGLQLAPNATRVLDRLKVLDAVAARGVAPRRLVLRDAVDGSELTSLDLGADFQARYGGVYLVVHRSDLLDVLVAAARDRGIALLTDAAVERVQQDPDRVVATTADGRSFAAGAVIAADGLHSQLRAGFSTDRPIWSGYVAYRGAVPAADAPAVDSGDVVAYLGPGLHLVQYSLRAGELVNQVAVFRTGAHDLASRQAVDGADPEDWGGPEELDAAFASTCDHVREALPLLWRDRRWPMFDRAPMTQWVDGRLALLGDAAHPMVQYLAQGACQAIQDAEVLADALAGSGSGSEPSALGAYAAARAGHTARVQTTARTWGEIWHVDGIARTLRNAYLRDRRVEDYRHIDWIYGASPGSAIG